jgi:hypothetical protein
LNDDDDECAWRERARRGGLAFAAQQLHARQSANQRTQSTTRSPPLFCRRATTTDAQSRA